MYAAFAEGSREYHVLMAFIKSADNRRDASFAVRHIEGSYSEEEDEAPDYIPKTNFHPDDDPANWEVWQP